MISVLSTTGKYILQPSLMDMHRQSQSWASTCQLWKQELAFFKKLLSAYASNLPDVAERKKADHFENLIMYYDGELIEGAQKKIRDHEKRLATMLQSENESDTQYFKEHQGLMNELQAVDSSFNEMKGELYAFIELRMK